MTQFINDNSEINPAFVRAHNHLKLLAKCEETILPNIDIRLILAALKGDSETIVVAEIDNSIKKTLYVLLFAIGHVALLEDFTQEERNIIMGRGLRYAAQNGDIEVVKTLLGKKSSTISVYYKGEALQKAAKYGHHHIVTLLVQAGAALSFLYKSRAIENAIYNGHHSVVKILIEKSHDVKRWLRLAVKQDNQLVIQTLLQQGSTALSADDKGEVLWRAAQKGYQLVVQSLLEEERVTLSVNNKEKALRLAAKNGHLEVVQILLERTAPVFAAYYKQRAFLFLEQNKKRAKIERKVNNSPADFSMTNRIINNGYEDIDYHFCDDELLNNELSHIINEFCHTFYMHSDGNWESSYKPCYARMIAEKISRYPSLIRKLLALEDRVVKMVTYEAINIINRERI